MREFRGAYRLATTVNATDFAEHAVIETLYADGQAIDPGRAELAETTLFNGAGIGLQRDFHIRLAAQTRADAGEQTVNGFRRKQARRAATDENAADDAPPHRRQFQVEISQERIDVLTFGESRTGLMRIEIAIRAFTHAPGNVHVECERWQCSEVEHEVRPSPAPPPICAVPGRGDSRHFLPRGVIPPTSSCASARRIRDRNRSLVYRAA